MADTAGKWLRVSTVDQTEASQEPDIDKWIAEHGYESGPVYTLHGLSAYKGKQDAQLDRVIEDMKLGKISVLVVWQSSRIERRGAYSAFDLARRVRDAGGRIEYVKDAYLNEANDMSDVMLALAATKDRKESQDKSERVKATHETIRSNHGVIGRPPFGYVTQGPKLSRQLVPTDIGRTYVPQIFARVTNGESLISIAQWLDSEDVPTNSTIGALWSAKSLSQIIRNETYVGTRKDANGEVACKCEALVSQSLWDSANKTLTESPKGRRGPRVKAPAMLSAVECGICGGNIYRNGQYYRCAGKGTQPKGCGAKGVRVEMLDALVAQMVAQDNRPIFATKFIPGTDKDGELNRIKKVIRDLDMDSDDYDSEYARLMSERKALLAADVTPDRWVKTDTGETFASTWASLDTDGQRDMLHNVNIIFKWVDVAGKLVEFVSVTAGLEFGAAQRF